LVAVGGRNDGGEIYLQEERRKVTWIWTPREEEDYSICDGCEWKYVSLQLLRSTTRQNVRICSHGFFLFLNVLNVVKIMESLEGFENKFSYAIKGHSGDYSDISFVDYDFPPKSIKEKYLILKKMTSHSIFCQ
jgi:hypothetical protein